MDKFIRSALLLGEENIKKLTTKTVMIFGCGGVGSYVIEGLVRTGIKNFVLIDNDTVSISNINRQIIATSSNIGELKTSVSKERILKINPDSNVLTYEQFINFHRRYYHPVNSYIYLYGDMDIVERLDWMDAMYLSKFEKV